MGSPGTEKKTRFLLVTDFALFARLAAILLVLLAAAYVYFFSKR